MINQSILLYLFDSLLVIKLLSQMVLFRVVIKHPGLRVPVLYHVLHRLDTHLIEPQLF